MDINKIKIKGILDALSQEIRNSLWRLRIASEDSSKSDFAKFADKLDTMREEILFLDELWEEREKIKSQL